MHAHVHVVNKQASAITRVKTTATSLPPSRTSIGLIFLIDGPRSSGKLINRASLMRPRATRLRHIDKSSIGDLRFIRLRKRKIRSRDIRELNPNVTAWRERSPCTWTFESTIGNEPSQPAIRRTNMKNGFMCQLRALRVPSLSGGQTFEANYSRRGSSVHGVTQFRQDFRAEKYKGSHP